MRKLGLAEAVCAGLLANLAASATRTSEVINRDWASSSATPAFLSRSSPTFGDRPRADF